MELLLISHKNLPFSNYSLKNYSVMSATGEVVDISPAVEQPPEMVKAAEEPKPVKEKKPKASKEKKPKQTKTTSHPPYFQMIKEALLALKEKNGSSPYAIAKFMEDKFKSVLPANFKKMLNLQLKNQAARGKLVKIKASYKLSEAEKPKKEKKGTKVTKGDVAEKEKQRQKRKRNVAVGGTKSKKNEAVKKVVKKKKSMKVYGPAKPKQPKSIKSNNNNKRVRKAIVANAYKRGTPSPRNYE